MPMFQRRHYDLLAHWAGNNLDLKSKAVAHLLDLLANDNPAFQKHRFITIAHGYRRMTDAIKGLSHNPTPIEANLDDVISNSEK